MIKSGKPAQMLKAFIKSAGGNPNIVDDYSLLPTAKNSITILSTNTGFVGRIEAEEIGKAAMILGAGRATKEDIIDHAVGLVLHKKVGDSVQIDDELATVYYNDDSSLEDSINMVLEAYSITKNKPQNRDVILDIKSVNI